MTSMQRVNRSRFGLFLGIVGLFCILATGFCVPGFAQQDTTPKYRGRKYKAPPETSKIEVTVLKGFNKKPIDGAHVIFHLDTDGKDEGYMELKTNQDGKTSIDVIPIGSKVRIQVLADGFATYAEDYAIAQPERAITIEMQRPRAQISTYVDNSDKAAERKPGIQEPIRPKKGSTESANTKNSKQNP